MPKELTGLDMAKQTDRYLRGIFARHDYFSDEFSSFAGPQTSARGMPESPDWDMCGCRIKLVPPP